MRSVRRQKQIKVDDTIFWIISEEQQIEHQKIHNYSLLEWMIGRLAVCWNVYRRVHKFSVEFDAEYRRFALPTINSFTSS